jgi:hypothetical protein
MTDTFPPAKQRPALLAFAKALDSRASALRRDECGDWQFGAITATSMRSPSRLTPRAAQQKLGFSS